MPSIGPLEVLAYSLLFAILCGFLAPTKGRESAPWFFVGMFFGIFGLAALAMVGREYPDTWRHCVHCGKPVDPSRRTLCQECGLPFAQ